MLLHAVSYPVMDIRSVPKAAARCDAALNPAAGDHHAVQLNTQNWNQQVHRVLGSGQCFITG